MHTPIHRLKEYYAEKEAQNTAEYTMHYLQRLFPDGIPALQMAEHDGQLYFALTGTNATDTCMVRFAIATNATVETIVKTVRLAVQEFRRMFSTATQ